VVLKELGAIIRDSRKLAFLSLVITALVLKGAVLSACEPGSRDNGPECPSPGECANAGRGDRPVGGRFAYAEPGSDADVGLFMLDAGWKETELGLEPFFGDLVDTIIVVGNSTTKRITIVREMSIKKGERLERKKIRRDSSYLKGLGFFSDVEIEAARTQPGRCSVTVRIEERPGLFLRYPYPVLNYDIDKGLSYGFKWKYRNFRGLGEELSLSFTKRRDKQHSGSLSWFMPWIGSHRLRFSSSLFEYRKLEEPEYDDFIKERLGGRIWFGVPLTRGLLKQIWVAASVSYEDRWSRLSLGNGCRNGCGEMYNQRFISTEFSLIYDSRDNTICPFMGAFNAFKVTRERSIYGLDQQYSFFSLINHFYIPTGDAGSLIIAVDGFARDGDLPYFFEMGLGGNNDLRGFYDSDLRGKVKILNTIQWRYQFFGPKIYRIPKIGKFDLALNGVIFADNGALTGCIEDFEHTRFHTTGGFGIEILSPVDDLVKIEVAFCRDRHPAYYLETHSRF